MSAAKKFFAHPKLVLPNLPGVALQLMRSFGDDNVNLNGLAELIGKDPALAAKVLRIANSARYSPLHSIASLREATSLLGMTTLRKLTMASCLSGSFSAIPGMDLARFWRHSIATAHLATELARVGMLDTDTAYLAGLMMRIGQLLMLQVDPAGVVDIEANVRLPGQRFALERQRWDCTHSDVTFELARRWEFPEALLMGLGQAASPLTAERFSPLAGVLHLAEALADAMDLGQAPIQAIQQSLPELIARLRLNTAWLADKMPDPAALAEEAQSLTAG